MGEEDLEWVEEDETEACKRVTIDIGKDRSRKEITPVKSVAGNLSKERNDPEDQQSKSWIGGKNSGFEEINSCNHDVQREDGGGSKFQERVIQKMGAEVSDKGIKGLGDVPAEGGGRDDKIKGDGGLGNILEVVRQFCSVSVRKLPVQHSGGGVYGVLGLDSAVFSFVVASVFWFTAGKPCSCTCYLLFPGLCCCIVPLVCV
ncbi:hypothetical protein L6452_37438 [Arctium lappa]|uniref:Uncharacterized protein n=1 Tax=Arctium lappa TaxID=4217 RepID=A0ACB8Y314_ARCLA|nr:hypothetical protein L6452_37438 [Arctium lappa]